VTRPCFIELFGDLNCLSCEENKKHMSWTIIAQCVGCKKLSHTSPTRSQLAHDLRVAGWTKGGEPGRIYCPECGRAAEAEKEKRNAKENHKSPRK
jgi:hypothetical protein